jgi:hypothetical protein
MEGAVPNTIRAISRFDMLFWPRSPMISANIFLTRSATLVTGEESTATNTRQE